MLWLFFRFHWILIQWKKSWKHDVTFIFYWKKWLFWGKYLWQWSLTLPFFKHSIWAWTENAFGNERHQKETKHIQASGANLLHVTIGNLDWCKFGHCKNETREIDCLCCREVDAMLIASAKIPEPERSISPSSFHGHLPN